MALMRGIGGSRHPGANARWLRAKQAYSRGAPMNDISVKVDQGVALISLNRPETRNAIDVAMIRGLQSALDTLEKAESGARALVLTGGLNGFCSGMNLHSIDLKTKKARQRPHFVMRSFMDPLILRLGTFRMPIIAAVHGAAVGAGLSLALACDIIIAADDAYFYPSFSRLGMVPDAGITFHLARRIGGGRALSSLLLAEPINAKTALLWGLVYETLPKSQVLARSSELALRLAKGPLTVLAQIRTLQASAFNHSLEQQLRNERFAQQSMADMTDCFEGVSAFFEKREPHFPV
jgi:2-(1,2-epoxy-1,2-dihydrophenyl)acetyl-CoA isomerase